MNSILKEKIHRTYKTKCVKEDIKNKIHREDNRNVLVRFRIISAKKIPKPNA